MVHLILEVWKYMKLAHFIKTQNTKFGEISSSILKLKHHQIKARTIENV